MLSLRLKRGLTADLPSEAPDGEIHVAIDTGIMWMGRGTGNALLRLPLQQITNASGVSNGNGDLTYTFPQAYATPPHVIPVAVATQAAHPTFAELISTTTTAVTIRTYRLASRSVFLGGTVDPDDRVSATVQLTIIGVLA